MAFAFDSGENSSLVAFAIKHYDELRRVAARRVGCAALASDIVQDTCVKAATLPDGAAIGNPRAFLHRVATNIAIDQLRQRGATAPLDADTAEDTLADPAPDAERVIAGRQRIALLQQAVAELPPRCRQVFTLRRFEDLGQEEIARRLGISRNMVERHLRHALDHCTRRLAELDA